MLSRGARAHEHLFSGLSDEVADAGAVVVDDDLFRIYTRVGRLNVSPPGKLADPAAMAFRLASRPLLEFQIRRRVIELANVHIIEGHQLVELRAGNSGITGVRINDHVASL